MATYYDKIPSGVSTQQVFEAVNGEVVAAMPGIAVAAHGDERMGEFFFLSEDEVFKACTDSREILQKLTDGSSLGTLCVSRPGCSVRFSRYFPKIKEDDNTVPHRDHYSVTVTLKSYAHIGDNARKEDDYISWLGLLEGPNSGSCVSESWGTTKDLNMTYRISVSNVVPFLREFGLGEIADVQAFGEVQEKLNFSRFTIDLTRFGFSGNYSVYPEWPIHSSTNYPIDAYTRFCALVDSNTPGVQVSVGRRYCAFRCKDGSQTRTLFMNRFDVYKTKTRRTFTVSFEQYTDEDPPVRMFSGGVRKRVAALGISI